MDPKTRPNHSRYLEVLRRMTPAEKAAKAFELSAWTKQLFYDGLRRLHPEMSPGELHSLYLDRLKKCHNRNY